MPSSLKSNDNEKGRKKITIFKKSWLNEPWTSRKQKSKSSCQWSRTFPQISPDIQRNIFLKIKTRKSWKKLVIKVLNFGKVLYKSPENENRKDPLTISGDLLPSPNFPPEFKEITP